jgi:hypothetical protein
VVGDFETRPGGDAVIARIRIQLSSNGKLISRAGACIWNLKPYTKSYVLTGDCVVIHPLRRKHCLQRPTPTIQLIQPRPLTETFGILISDSEQ